MIKKDLSTRQHTEFKNFRKRVIRVLQSIQNESKKEGHHIQTWTRSWLGKASQAINECDDHYEKLHGMEKNK